MAHGNGSSPGQHGRCPVCQVWLEREEGYFLGAMALNIVIGEFVPVFAAIAVVIAVIGVRPLYGVRFWLSAEVLGNQAAANSTPCASSGATRSSV